MLDSIDNEIMDGESKDEVDDVDSSSEYDVKQENQNLTMELEKEPKHKKEKIISQNTVPDVNMYDIRFGSVPFGLPCIA